MAQLIDLSRTLPPDLIDSLDFEATLADRLADFQGRYTDYDTLVESDPALKSLESAAYREVLLRNRINAAGRAALVSLALHFSTPTAPDAYTTAGSQGSYEYWAKRGRDADLRDVHVYSPTPMHVTVVLVGSAADGAVDAALIAAVEADLSTDGITPVGDVLTVQAADVVEYDVTAELFIPRGPDPDIVRAAAQTALEAYAESAFRGGETVPINQIYAALTVPGVGRVILTEPTADVAITDAQAPKLGTLTLT